MGMPRDLAAYMAQRSRAAAPQPVRSTQIGGGGRAPSQRFRVGGNQTGTVSAAETVVSAPAPVPQEQPAQPAATTAVTQPVDFQSLLDQQAAQFETQISGLRFQAEETQRQQRESASQIITTRLADYGLESLGGFVSNLVFTEGVVDTNIIMGRLRATPEYKQRFAGNEQRRKAGLNVLSEGEYVALENSYRQLMRQSGLPTGFYDSNDDFTDLIANDVSVGELSERVNQGFEAVMNADPEVVSEMRRLYNIGDGELAAYFLDPERATPTLLRQARSAQIAGAFVQQADMELSQAQALQLEAAGISPEQARAGAQAITGAQELFRALPGEAEQDITQEEQIAGVFGTSAAAQQRIRQRTRERQAVFEAGGGFAAQGSQVTGLT